MSLKVLLVAAYISFVNAGFLEPAPATLKLAVSAPAPVVSLLSPAVTRTEYTPGSYSSSYRSDTITPRVRYTETPGVSITVPQPSVAIAPAVTRVEHLAPITPSIERVERIVPALPTIARLEPLPSVRFASAPLLETRTLSAIPAISKVEHLASSVARVEHVGSLLLTERIVPELTFARGEPAIAKTLTLGTATPIVRSELGLVAPSVYTYGIGGLATRELTFGQRIHL